jgi:cell division protein WhiA
MAARAYSSNDACWHSRVCVCERGTVRRARNRLARILVRERQGAVTDPTATLAEDTRAELAAIAPERRCDRLAELSALFHAAGSLHLRGRGKVALHLDLASSAVVRRAFALLRALDVESEIRTYARRAFERGTRYQLHLAGDRHALAILAEAGVLDRHRRPLARPPRRVVGRSCCRGAYLRGALLAAGSLSGPPSPHLELRAATLEGAEFLAEVARAGGADLSVRERTRHALAYAKGWEAIETVLGNAGATDAVLALEERSVVAAARAQANRLANADHANLVRTSRAAQAQLEAVRRLRAAGAWPDLDDRLREAAALRLRHPTLSLRELAARASPPATKAGMHRRLERLVDLAR